MFNKYLFLFAAALIATSCVRTARTKAEETKYQQNKSAVSSPTAEESTSSDDQTPEGFVQVPKSSNSSEQFITSEMTAKERKTVRQYEILISQLQSLLNTENHEDLNNLLKDIQAIRSRVKDTAAEKGVNKLNYSVAIIIADRIGTSKQKKYDTSLYGYFSKGSRGNEANINTPSKPPRVFKPEEVNSDHVNVVLRSITQEKNLFIVNLTIKNKKKISQMVLLRDVRVINRSEKIRKPEHNDNRWQVPGEYQIYKFEGGLSNWKGTHPGVNFRKFAPNSEENLSLIFYGQPKFDTDSYSLALTCNSSNFLFNKVYPSDRPEPSQPTDDSQTVE